MTFSFLNFLSFLIFCYCNEKGYVNIIQFEKENTVIETPNNNVTYYNLSKEILTVYDEKIVFYIALIDLDHLNDNFHVIKGVTEDREFKNAYIKSYDKIFKASNQTPLEISINYPNLKEVTKLIHDMGTIQIKFVKEILFETNYLDMKSFNYQMITSKILDKNLKNIYDYHILTSKREEDFNFESFKGYHFINYTKLLSNLEEFNSNNFTEKELNNFTLFCEEFTKFFHSKLKLRLRINKILNKILDSKYSKINLRNHLKEFEIEKIIDHIGDIKSVILFLDDTKAINKANSEILIQKLENKVNVLNDYVSSFNININLSNIIFFYIIYILIIITFLGYLCSTTLKEFAEYYKKKFL